MEEHSIKCDICNKRFDSKDSLSQHNLAKHSAPAIAVESKKISYTGISLYEDAIVPKEGIFDVSSQVVEVPAHGTKKIGFYVGAGGYGKTAPVDERYGTAFNLTKFIEENTYNKILLIETEDGQNVDCYNPNILSMDVEMLDIIRE